MKATSLFGGVQVFNILISIVRSKFIAILLGPTGMGIAGLLNSTTGLIAALTNLGLGTSAIKNVSTANSTGDQTRIAIIITVLRRWVWVTGLLGMIVTIVTAPLLSRLAFGNSDYTFPFIWISISLLLTQLSSGQMALLQGLRKLQFLAKANLAGSIIGLFATVPLYYLFGLKGIVPAIILTSVITLSGSWYFARKVKFARVTVSKATTITEGQDMLKMGFMISLSGLMALGAAYIVRIFISQTRGVEQVGLYNAGFAIINTYVGLIFTAMSTDYYPRLSAVSHNNKLCKQSINQQAEIAILILAPILIGFLIFINWLVILLYSIKFIAVNEMIYWAALGMFFKATSWAVAFIFLAKGSIKLFFWSELTAQIYMLGFNLLGYYLMGLTGLGISFAVGYLFYSIQVYLISKIKFEFSFDQAFLKIFGIQFALAILGFFSVIYISKPYMYVIGVLLIGISVWFSFKELDKRIDLYALLNKIRNRISFPI